MPIEALPLGIAAEIDSRHQAMRVAFRRRDLDAYAACLASEVAYIRVDGSIGDRDALIDETQRQFRRVAEFEAETVRVEAGFDGTVVCETLDQVADVTTVAFWVVRRRWRLERRQAYEWVRQDGDWRVRRVAITLLRTVSNGWGWGRMP